VPEKWECALFRLALPEAGVVEMLPVELAHKIDLSLLFQ